jgi:hypothetical protein
MLCQVCFVAREKCNKIVNMRLMLSLCKNYILSSKRRYWSVWRFISCTERLGGGEADAEQRALFSTIFDKMKFLSHMNKVQSVCNTIQQLCFISPQAFTHWKDFKARGLTWTGTAIASKEYFCIKVAAMSVNLSARIARTLPDRPGPARAVLLVVVITVVVA